MEGIYIEATKETPQVIFNPEQGIFSISGTSLPEDVKEFYGPIIEWFTDYFTNPLEKTVLRFKLMYFNTASSKMIYELMQRCKRAFESGLYIKIIWQFIAEDDEMEEAGADYQAMMGEMPFELESVEFSV